LNFELVLFLDHGDVTWDSPKGESSKGKKGFIINTILGRMRKVVGTLY
jgi:hypothetical protein